VVEVSRKALKATVALKTVAVFREVKVVTDISYYLHVRKSVTFVIN
jgi:hypothetical protein